MIDADEVEARLIEAQREIIPVIHYANDNQAMRNAERAFDAGCTGVMLIDMEGRDYAPVWVAGAIKRRWPGRLVGLNFLNARSMLDMPIARAPDADMTWTDLQLTHTSLDCVATAMQASAMLLARPGHMLFCAVAFKYQDPEPDPCGAARKAVELGFIPTTSGPATGQAADVDAVKRMRDAIGPDAPLAIASGVTPENAELFLPLVSHVLVSTGVSSSFHEFDRVKLNDLMQIRKVLQDA